MAGAPAFERGFDQLAKLHGGGFVPAVLGFPPHFGDGGLGGYVRENRFRLPQHHDLHLHAAAELRQQTREHVPLLPHEASNRGFTGGNRAELDRQHRRPSHGRFEHLPMTEDQAHGLFPRKLLKASRWRCADNGAEPAMLQYGHAALDAVNLGERQPAGTCNAVKIKSLRHWLCPVVRAGPAAKCCMRISKPEAARAAESPSLSTATGRPPELAISTTPIEFIASNPLAWGAARKMNNSKITPMSHQRVANYCKYQPVVRLLQQLGVEAFMRRLRHTAHQPAGGMARRPGINCLFAARCRASEACRERHAVPR